MFVMSDGTRSVGGTRTERAPQGLREPEVMRPCIRMSLTLPPLPTAFNRELCAKVGKDISRRVEKKLRFRLYGLAAGKTPKSKVNIVLDTKSLRFH